MALYTAPAGKRIDDPAIAQRIRDLLAALPKDQVAAVTSLWGTAAPQLIDRSGTRGLAVVTLVGDNGNGAPTRQQVVRELRALPTPPGVTLLVGGKTASSMDSLGALTGTLPWMGLLLVGETFLLMFLAFGSVVLPVKAVLMSAPGLGSTLGFLTLIFSDGHLAGLMGITHHSRSDGSRGGGVDGCHRLRPVHRL